MDDKQFQLSTKQTLGGKTSDGDRSHQTTVSQKDLNMFYLTLHNVSDFTDSKNHLSDISNSSDEFVHCIFVKN